MCANSVLCKYVFMYTIHCIQTVHYIYTYIRTYVRTISPDYCYIRLVPGESRFTLQSWMEVIDLGDLWMN